MDHDTLKRLITLLLVFLFLLIVALAVSKTPAHAGAEQVGEKPERMKKHRRPATTTKGAAAMPESGPSEFYAKGGARRPRESRGLAAATAAVSSEPLYGREEGARARRVSPVLEYQPPKPTEEPILEEYHVEPHPPEHGERAEEEHRVEGAEKAQGYQARRPQGPLEEYHAEVSPTERSTLEAKKRIVREPQPGGGGGLPGKEGTGGKPQELIGPFQTGPAPFTAAAPETPLRSTAPAPMAGAASTIPSAGAEILPHPPFQPIVGQPLPYCVLPPPTTSFRGSEVPPPRGFQVPPRGVPVPSSSARATTTLPPYATQQPTLASTAGPTASSRAAAQPKPASAGPQPLTTTPSTIATTTTPGVPQQPQPSPLAAQPAIGAPLSRGPEQQAKPVSVISQGQPTEAKTSSSRAAQQAPRASSRASQPSGTSSSRAPPPLTGSSRAAQGPAAPSSRAPSQTSGSQTTPLSQSSSRAPQQSKASARAPQPATPPVLGQPSSAATSTALPMCRLPDA